MIRLAIVDDQALIREGIANLLSLADEFTVCWQLDSGIKVCEQLSSDPIDVLLMDIRMPGVNGIEALTQLRKQHFDCKVIILTTFDDPQLFVDAMQAGANGFLLKDVDTEKLHHAVHRVYNGQTLAEPVLLNQLNAAQLSTFGDNEIEPLSERETDILKLIAAGLSNKEIAQAIFLAEGTVKNHVSSLLAKLNTRDRTRAVLKALSAKII
ncbi:response regulator transcription factor [Pseudoalteromonas sp. SR44-5]|jgi:DNA-binding NarL/FixJ family response regulator|uniref:Response regulator transcription factor n=2 Tax=Pseudoalteromonas TaxID=53246 RepID=A0ABY3FAY8_9GAMM|nr:MULTISPECIES: response regulator transcription factor [Pseudoalteromonas]MBB1292904.1 response regulator transcription factor [Pseudoalteromonas sp. SR41-4]MBB1302889.1 response regulator transcription factor [Pseudoalteromonas sp. SR44-8]MBB1308989.1 response regulator transcription factor [Pseudoalteromonas sp. SR41-8]MBB1366594.1 response regulator transcription factor [Pseudoalteromonas sp. SR44-5]MBB1399265.1 response regulator transcription factor [Pseudoalteromonas sp. SG44-8]|tara:strand:- start:34599 stop:35228 length:630 start_codon:yes stop_codon:yes gene_type:complete